MRLFLFFFLFPLFIIGQQNTQQLAYQYYINGQYKKAIEIYKELDQEKFKIAYYTPYYFSLLKTNEYRAAEQLAKKVAYKYPKSLNYQIDVVVAQSRGGTKKVDDLFRKVIQKLNGSRNQAINLANTFNKHTMYEFALEVYLFAEKENAKLNFGLYKAQLYSNLEKTDLMIKEYLNVLFTQPDQKDFIISKVQRFINNDGIKSDENYQLVKRLLLPYVRKEDNRTDFSEMLIWLFMQNAQHEMALRQAKALDRRINGDGENVYDLGDSFLDNQYYKLAIEAYDYVLEKGRNNFLFINANINKLYALTNMFKEQNNDITLIDNIYKNVIEEVGKNRETVLLLSNYAHFQAFYLHDLVAAKNTLKETISIPGISMRDLAECKLEYADVMLLSGNIWESLLYYTQVEKDFKESPIGHDAKLRRAKVAYYQGDFQWAQAQLDVLKASTSKLIANDALDLSLLIADNYNLDTSEVAMKMFAEADLLNYQKRYNVAIVKYDSILTLFEGHSLSDEIYMRKAEIYLNSGNIESSLAMYQKIIDEWDYDILADDAIYKQARIYEDKLKETSKAMQLYEKILLEKSGSVFTAEARKRFRELRGDNLNLQ